MVLPAYAGMIRPEGPGSARPRRAPRVCGDDPLQEEEYERSDGVLPAYAGMIPA